LLALSRGRGCFSERQGFVARLKALVPSLKGLEPPKVCLPRTASWANGASTRKRVRPCFQYAPMRRNSRVLPEP